MLQLPVARLQKAATEHDLLEVRGRLRSATGLLLSGTLPAAVGDQGEVILAPERTAVAEVIGFGEGLARMVLYESADTVQPGMPVRLRKGGPEIPVGSAVLGRVLDGLGRPLDQKPALDRCTRRPLGAGAPTPMERARVREPFVTSQRAIDGLLTLGRGQRVGIFAGSGVGKTTLLGEIARGAEADVTVLALIGERGREVKPFLDDCLGDAGMARAVVVVATCDQTPLMRVRAAQAALTMADDFRMQGANVLFMLDSLTRLAMAQRELGLALGEPPSARGYTPSVFQLLATTIEALGNADRGGITGVLTVLVDGGDLDEPISDAVRSLVDGHIVLDRRLAERGHYPAINVAQSISRIAYDVTSVPHQASARKLRSILATHAEAEDLIRIGAYAKGSSPPIDRMIELMPAVNAFLCQGVGDRSSFGETQAAMAQIAAAWPF